MIIAFNFDKINIERKSLLKGKVEIKNNLAIDTIEEEQLMVKTENKAIKFDFTYSVVYEPKVGNIYLKGHLIYMADSKKINELLASWKKSKKLGDEKIATQVLTTVLTKCNIKALALSKEIGLPQPVPLPIRINSNASPKNYIG